jgi:hypothetical protein
LAAIGPARSSDVFRAPALDLLRIVTTKLPAGKASHDLVITPVEERIFAK